MLDGDDQWRPLKAERHIAVMEAAPEVALTFSNSEYINEDGSPTGRFLISDKAEVTLRDMVRRNYVGSGSSPFLRRDRLASAGLFREDLAVCEDYELWCRVLNRKSCPGGVDPEILTLYQRTSRQSHRRRKLSAERRPSNGHSSFLGSECTPARPDGGSRRALSDRGIEGIVERP